MRDDLLDQIGAETAAARLVHRRPVAFDPFDFRQRVVDLAPMHRDLAPGDAERTELGRIGRQFVDREPQRQRIIGRQLGMRPHQIERMVLVARIGCELDLDHRTDRRGAPFGLGQQVVRGRQRADAAVETFGEFVEVLRPAPRQRYDRKDIGERVLDPVVELARQRVADRVLFLEPADRAAVLERLLGQQAGHEHQQAGDRQPEQQRDHRHGRQTFLARGLHFEQHRPVGEAEFAGDRGAPLDPAVAMRDRDLRRGIRIEQARPDRLVTDQFAGRAEELRGIERTVDEALELARAAQPFEHRHIYEEARSLAVAFLLQDDRPAGSGPIVRPRQIHRGPPDGFRIHVVAERAAIAHRVGLQVENRSEHVARLFGQGRRHPLFFHAAAAQPGFEFRQFGRSDDRGPADPLCSAVIGIQPQFGNEAAEQFGRDLVLRRQQRGAGTQVGRTGIGAAFDRRSHRLRLARDIRGIALRLAALDREDAEHGYGGDQDEDQHRNSARIVDQPTPAAPFALEFFAYQLPAPDGLPGPIVTLTMPRGPNCSIAQSKGTRHRPMRCAKHIAGSKDAGRASCR